MPKGTYTHAWGRRDYNAEPVQYDREHPHICVGRPVVEFTDIEVCRNIPTYVGKALKMLSKIKYLTFSKVPNLMAFISVVQNPVLFTCQRTSSPLSGNEPPYNTLSRTIVNQHHETEKDRIRKTNTAKDARKETRMDTKVHDHYNGTYTLPQ